jgi:mannose/fructose/N-acetylgalactosamine-specific phosphotransferase system component IIC
MSIMDKNGEQFVKLSGVWDFLAKAAIALAIPVFLLFVSWGVWVTTSTFQHGQDIAVMQENQREINSRLHGVSSQIGQLLGKLATKMKPENDE